MINISATVSKSNELVSKGGPLRQAVAASYGYGDVVEVRRKGKNDIQVKGDAA